MQSRRRAVARLFFCAAPDYRPLVADTCSQHRDACDTAPRALDQLHNNALADISNSRAPLEQALLNLFESNARNLFADIEARVVRCAFEYCQHNQLQTAKLLGVSRNILRHRLKLYGML